MPLDPFFTSKVKDDFPEKCDRRRAYAKAIQMRRFIENLPKLRKLKAIEHRLSNPDILAARAFAKGKRAIQSSGGPGGRSLTGFKEPKKKWDEPKI